MDMPRKNRKSATYKVDLFRSYFSGLTNAYGIRDPNTDRAWQVKEAVNYITILQHLQGKLQFGVYLLFGDRTRAIAADFDDSDPFPPVEFVNAAKHYGMNAYIEISKSKGFHAWIFGEEKGVKAFKARLVVKNILEEIGCPKTEIFPKQSLLNSHVAFGNFILAPLFGRLVPMGKTVFIDPKTLEPYPDQWVFLESVKRVDEQVLDDIIEINDLSSQETIYSESSSCPNHHMDTNRFGIPPCAQKIFQNGVSQYQRVSCFRLAVHLKRLGFPFDVAVAALKIWALKNRPKIEDGIITEKEIIAQASYAYSKNYRGYGCGSEAIRPFCAPECPLVKKLSEPASSVMN